MELSKQFTFEASHVLPNHPGKCANLHGHSWVLTVYIDGPVDKETGMVDDYGNIKAIVQPVIDELDHKHLGATKFQCGIYLNLEPEYFDVPTKWLVPWLPGNEWNPTSENLLIEIGKQLVKRGLVFMALTLNETCTTTATVYWEEFNAIISSK